jgi:hypothetical protein
MSLFSFKPLISVLATVALLTACGGSGQSASPPVGGLSLEAGEAGVTVTWTAVSGVEYWLYGAPNATICKNCGTNDWKTITGAFSRGQSNDPITSPYFMAGLTNDSVYAFIMDGRINGGPGGVATPSVSTTPRLAGEYWYANSVIGSGGIKGLAFGPTLDTTTNTYAKTGTYLGLGANGAKYQSTDGANWSSIAGTDTTSWLNASYALNKFIGVGANGAVTYSTDLKTWTVGSSGVAQNLNALASNGSIVVAVGDNGTIVRSSDAASWTAATFTPSTQPLYGVSYTANGIWVAVGAAGTLLTSSDAATWTAVNTGTTTDLKGVASFSNVVTLNGVASTVYSTAVVGSNGTVLQSADGSTWTHPDARTSAHLNAIVASSGVLPSNQFVAVGDSGVAFTSPDGLNWTARTTHTSQNLTHVIRTTAPQNRYLALGADSSTVYTK